MANGVVVACNRLYTKLFCELNFEQVEVNARIENGKAVFECDKFVWGSEATITFVHFLNARPEYDPAGIR